MPIPKMPHTVGLRDARCGISIPADKGRGALSVEKRGRPAMQYVQYYNCGMAPSSATCDDDDDDDDDRDTEYRDYYSSDRVELRTLS